MARCGVRACGIGAGTGRARPSAGALPASLISHSQKPIAFPTRPRSRDFPDPYLWNIRERPRPRHYVALKKFLILS